jgi:murein DD-endopeptidase MepM/ murein hydrolase activator NlpD
MSPSRPAPSAVTAAIVAGTCAVLAVPVGLRAQTSPSITVRLGFPIQGMSPYSARITSAFDHNRNKWGIDGNGTPLLLANRMGTIVSWLGERARRDTDGPAYPYPNLTTLLGYGGDGKKYPRRTFRTHGSDRYLWYEKPSTSYEHPGYDYGIPAGRVIVSPAAGQLYVVGTDPLFGETWKGFHAFRIDHGNGVSTWFLHASRFVRDTDPGRPGDWEGVVKSKIGAGGYAGTTAIRGEVWINPVRKGEAVALVGGFRDFTPHLHMEVRYRNAEGRETLVDPYGWEGDGEDPLPENPGRVLWEGFDPPTVTDAATGATPGQVTVSGSGFSALDKVEVWRRFELSGDTSNQRDGTFVATCQSRLESASKLVGEGCGALDPAQHVVKVLRSSTSVGPRSRATRLSQKAVLVSPAPGSTLSSAGPTFTWSAASGASVYWVYIGSGPGDDDLYFGSQGLRQSLGPLPGFATDGRPVYVTLWSLVGGNWLNDSQRYYTPGRPSAPSLRVNGKRADSRSAGQPFVFDGWGFTPLGTVSRWVCGPLSCTQLSSLSADRSGRFDWTYTAPCSSGTFTDRVWVHDDGTDQWAYVEETIVKGTCPW